MIMIQGSGSISNYKSYINNCQAKQMPYRIPVTSLSDVQLFISIGLIKPDAVQYEIIDTCSGATMTITPDYVIGQDSNLNWYGVFKNFSGASYGCFVIAVTLTFGVTDKIYFSQEYCIENCQSLQLIKGCYGNLDNKLSYDCEGVYFGSHAGTDTPLGNTAIVYKHELYLRDVEVSLSAIKNTFKQGLTRNFRTEKQKLYQFLAERVPEWYLGEIDAVFYRGEVYVDTTRYLVSETQFEKIEDCLRQWQPKATFLSNCLQSFSCEVDPCSAQQECCTPEFISVDVSEVPTESGFPVESGSGGGGLSGIVVIQAVVDGTLYVTGTVDPVTGITGGSTVISCGAFAGRRIFMERGSVMTPGIDPGDGSNFYTKNVGDSFITLSAALAPGELIYIETI